MQAALTTCWGAGAAGGAYTYYLPRCTVREVIQCAPKYDAQQIENEGRSKPFVHFEVF